MDINNLFGAIIILLPVCILAYITIKNVKIDKNINLNQPDQFTENEKMTDKTDKKTDKRNVEHFDVRRFDNNVKGYDAIGIGVEEMTIGNSGDSDLANPNWLGSTFYQKRESLGKMEKMENKKTDGDLVDTNNLVEGFLDVGFGEALRDGLNTLLGKSDDRDMPSVNPDLSYVKTQPDIPFHDPRVGSVADAPTAAVKIPVLVDDKQAVAQRLNRENREIKNGIDLSEVGDNLITDKKEHQLMNELNSKDFVDTKREIGFGVMNKAGKVPLGNEQSVLQQLYSGDAKGTIKSGKREFADDVDVFKPLFEGKVKCQAYAVMRDGKIVQVNITNSGNAYEKIPVVKLIGGGNDRKRKDAMLKAVLDDNGAVVYIDIEDEGENYEKTPDVRVE